MKRLLYPAIAFFSALTSCSGPYKEAQGDETPITEQSIREVVENGSESALIDVLDRAKEAAVTNEELAYYLLDLWQSDSVIEPRVRVVLADVVSQLARNGMVQMDTRPVHEYLRRSATSSIGPVERRAISALSVFDSVEDVALLEDLANNANSLISRSAIGALGAMCNGEADAALMRLTTSDDDDVREFAAQTKREFDEFERTSRWCER